MGAEGIRTGAGNGEGAVVGGLTIGDVVDGAIRISEGSCVVPVAIAGARSDSCSSGSATSAGCCCTSIVTFFKLPCWVWMSSVCFEVVGGVAAANSFISSRVSGKVEPRLALGFVSSLRICFSTSATSNNLQIEL